MKRKKVTLQRISGALCRALDKAEALLDSDLPPDMVLRACSTIATIAGAAVRCYEAERITEPTGNTTPAELAAAFAAAMTATTGQGALPSRND